MKKLAKKRMISVFLVLFLFLGMLPAGFPTVATETEDGLIYEIADGQVTITGYTGGTTEVLAIPAEIEGLPVTVIGANAFSGCSSLTHITIPDGVTVIGLGAFQDCWMLTNITILESVTAIGQQAFMGCGSLSSITIPDSVTSIAERTFEDCKNLTSIDIPNSVTTIGYRAFNWCVSLSSVTFGDSVTTIDSFAFGSCTSLASMMIPESVTRIDSVAFYGCTSLTSIYFDGHAPAIGSDSFEGVTANAYYYANLTSWTEDKLQNYGGAITWTGIGETIPACLEYEIYEDHVEITDCRDSLTDVVIPAEIDRLPVTVICDEAFRYCENLISVSIPDSVTTIGEYAFMGCESLTGISIPDGITHIGDYAFYLCSSLTGNVTIPVNLTFLGTGVFAACASLTSVTIQDGVTAIADQTFSRCSGLTSINIPDSVISIGERAFERCDGLTSVNIPAGVTFIGYEAFYQCSKLTSIRFNGNAPEFGKWVFLDVYGTAYYPGDNPTWTSELMENCNNSSITWVAYGDVSGVTLGGGITSYANDTATVIVELLNGDGEVVKTAAVTGNNVTYTFADIAAGTYFLRVSKANHVTRSYEIVVGDADVTQDVTLLPIGDITGDGKVTATDYSRLLAHVKKTSSIADEYTLACADVTGDGKITATDYSRLLAHVKKVSPLW